MWGGVSIEFFFFFFSILNDQGQSEKRLIRYGKIKTILSFFVLLVRSSITIYIHIPFCRSIYNASGKEKQEKTKY